MPAERGVLSAGAAVGDSTMPPVMDMVARRPSGVAVAGPAALVATGSVPEAAVGAVAVAVEHHMRNYVPG